jgi:hypothetical protein
LARHASTRQDPPENEKLEYMYGVWYMVYGIWCMVYGVWYMVYADKRMPQAEKPQPGKVTRTVVCTASSEINERQIARL